MKFLLVVVSLVVAVAAYEPIFSDYHEEIGIPQMARIKLAESAMDFDGSRITGGQLAALGANPHLGGMIITLSNWRQSVCGSSLVSRVAVVTAAHCWRHGSNQGIQITVVLGSITLSSGGTRINSNNVQMHANYNQNNLNNDIAVVRIAQVNLSNNIQVIRLATGTNLFVGTWARAAGYGRTSDTSGTSNQQRHVNVQVIGNALCQQTYGPSVVIASTLCVATPGGQGVCGGDSGGPLVTGNAASGNLVGVTQFVSAAGCTQGLPAGFGRVTAFAAWINARI